MKERKGRDKGNEAEKRRGQTEGQEETKKESRHQRLEKKEKKEQQGRNRWTVTNGRRELQETVGTKKKTGK